MRGIEASCSHRLTRERKAKKSKQVYMKKKKIFWCMCRDNKHTRPFVLALHDKL